MCARYFSAALVGVSVAAALWIALTPSVLMVELILAVLFGLLGFVSLSTGKRETRTLFFAVGVLFSLYIFGTAGHGVLVGSLLVLSLLGMVLSLGRPSTVSAKKKPVKKKASAIAKPAKKKRRSKK
jgi:uncharacterized membrane protein YccC